MEPLRGIALLAIGLTVLHDGPLAQYGLGAIEMAAGDVHHRHLEVHERKILVEIARASKRLQPFFAPCGVCKTELIAPVARLERDGAARGGQRLGGPAGAHEQERERGVGIGQVAFELDRAPDVVDRARQQPSVGLVARP